MKNSRKIQTWLVDKKLYSLVRIYLFIYSKIFKLEAIDYWDICDNLEWINEMNITQNFTNKKEGITWIARLHNSDEFLEIVLESWIDLLDEIIVIDNLSTDNTKHIVDKLIAKYGEKIKYYFYPYEINCHEWWKHWDTEFNSVHSLSYYYNWSFSKANYWIVTKIDDDDYVFLNKIEKDKLRKKVLKIKENVYLMYSWYNIIKKGDEFWLRGDLKYPWFLWDHWFYRPNRYSTYYKFKTHEHLRIRHMKLMRYNHIYYHFKFLKSKYSFDVTNNYLHNYEKNDYISNDVKKIFQK